MSNTEAPASLVWRGKAMVWAVQIAEHALQILVGLIVVIGVLSIIRTLLLFGASYRHARSRRGKNWSWGPEVVDPVSVIVPAYNEREGIAAAVRSLATGSHREIEVVVVDDGSTDGTAKIARRLKLPNVRVVSVPNGGKSAALNRGIALATHDLIVMVDGDTVFEHDSVHQLVQPFADPRVGAVAGNVKVGNRRSLVARWQHIEYVIGFNLDRRLYDELQIMPTIPGAIGAFRREALEQVGGVSEDTLAEDTDLTIAVSRAGWRVVYEEKARAWTEAPASISQLWTQRYRWSYGTMQALWKHRHAITDRGRSGRFGRLGLPILALYGIVMPTAAPLIDIIALYDLYFHNRLLGAAAWLGMLALQFMTAVIAFRLDKESLRPLLVLPLQQFVYRQLMYFVIIRSAVTALTGARLRWQKLRRVGDVAVPAGGAARG
jgi:cellulose synthase/poly-beta-1,6-N-acetylglucosamine synthase-like glycosyltransferase